MSEAAEAADDLDKLAQAADNAGKALEENAKAASLAGAQLDKLKELAIGALGGEETVEKYKKASEALKLFNDKGASTGQRAVAGAVAVKQFASAAVAMGGAVAGAASTVVQLVDQMYRAEAAAQQYDQRIGSLSGSLGAMRTATAGAVDTQVAFNASFALADRGIEANAQTMAIAARVTREFARDRQVTQEQASAVFQRALDGDAQAAQQLGLRLNDTTTTTQRHAAIIAQLEARYRGVAAEQQTAAERAQVYERAQQQANNKISSWLGYIAAGPVASFFYTGLVKSIANQNEQTDAATKAQQRHNAVLKQSVDLARARLSAEEQRATYERRNAAISLGAINEELQRRGVVIATLGETINAEQAYGRARLDVMQASRRADETGAQFDQRKIELAQRLTDAIRRRNAEATRQDTLRNAEAELGVMAHQIRAMGGTVDARIRSITPAQRLAQIQREIADFAARENESIEETYQRRNGLFQQEQAALATANQAANAAQDAARARREYNDLLNEASNLGVKIAQVESRAGESAGDRIGRQIQAQRELNELMQQSYDAADEHFQRFQEQTRTELALQNQKAEEERAAANERTRVEYGRQVEQQRARETQQREMNAAVVAAQRADATEQRLRDAFGLAQDQMMTTNQAVAQSAKAGYDAIGELGSAAVNAAIEAANAGGDVLGAVAKQVDDWAAAKAVQWGLQSLEALASAGIAYFIRPDAVPGLLTSAATFAVMAGAAAITTAAIPNAPAASSGAGAGGRERVASSPRNESASSGKAMPAMVFNVSGYTSTESAQEGIVRAFEEAKRRGLWQG